MTGQSITIFDRSVEKIHDGAMMRGSQRRPAGRPRIVERDEALDRAKELFWSLGYQRASLPEVERATGLQRGSLYALFSDKRELFLATLDLYGRQALAMMDSLMPKGAARADILAWTKAHAARAHGPAGIRGCFLIETIVEMGPHDPAIAMQAAAIFDAMLKRLELALASARDAEIKTPAVTARALLAGLEGLRVLGKAGQSEDEVMRAVETLTAQLVPPAPSRRTRS
jgi:TetR/AcrR family transcriptional repressor of nem operon